MDSHSASANDVRRFARQVRFAGIGLAGQAQIAASRVLVVGCGATGGALAQSLYRAGVGELVLVDRDVVEESNLPRQVLFDASHVARRLPKVDAARETLQRVEGPTVLETHTLHLDATVLARLARRARVVLDGTDNMATRYLINDYAVKRNTPWIYAGVVGGSGIAMAIVPGGPCLRCLFPTPPPAGTLPTCESAGVVQPAVAAVAAMQAGLALRLLASEPGHEPFAAIAGQLVELDVWNGSTRTLKLERDPDCPACAKREFPFLVDSLAQGPQILCGRNTVQIPPATGSIDLDALVLRLGASDGLRVERRGDLVRLVADDLAVTVFGDGRALVEGTEDISRAVALCDRLLS